MSSLLPVLMDIALNSNDPWDGFGHGIFADDLLPHSSTCLRPRLVHQPEHYTGYRRPWAMMRCNPQLRKVVEGASKSGITKDGFQVCIDVQQFSPNEITVKTVDNAVVVEGKHEEREDDHGFISRQFTRRYVLPKEFDVKDVVSTLSSDGVLTIKAPPLAKAIEGNERVVQIQQTGPARLNIKDSKSAENAAEAEEKK